jgi:hypothetical protein
MPWMKTMLRSTSWVSRLNARYWGGALSNSTIGASPSDSTVKPCSRTSSSVEPRAERPASIAHAGKSSSMKLGSGFGPKVVWGPGLAGAASRVFCPWRNEFDVEVELACSSCLTRLR